MLGHTECAQTHRFGCRDQNLEKGTVYLFRDFLCLHRFAQIFIFNINEVLSINIKLQGLKIWNMISYNDNL